MKVVMAIDAEGTLLVRVAFEAGIEKQEQVCAGVDRLRAEEGSE
jgi:hypothetical protein